MSLAAKEEALIDCTEAEAFMAECHGWQDVTVTYEDGTTFTNAERFNGGYGVVLHIDSDDWAKWLAGYELVEDPNPEYVSRPTSALRRPNKATSTVCSVSHSSLNAVNGMPSAFPLCS